MWNQLANELKNSKIYIYSVAITACILSIFGFVIFIASAGDEPVGVIPSPSPTSFADILGAKTEARNGQIQQQSQAEPVTNAGPEQPVIVPSPSPSPKVSPSPSLIASPSPSPSVSPSPTPTPTSQPNTDTSGPSISAIQSKNVESKRATIEWTTNEDADGKVEFGKETSYGTNKESNDKKTSHSQDLTDLEANTTYHYRVISKDNAGNSTTSGDNTFTTLP